ncbi:MAG: polyprenyl synthetase family protein [Verrucomicrobiota bacterium]
MTVVATAKNGKVPADTLRVFEAAGPFLGELEQFFEDQKVEFEPELQELVEYAITHSGKRLRPIALYLSSANSDRQIPKRLVQAAAVVELVHLATLVHDDILDHADLRHESETVARRFGVSAAVLLGDALFAQALQLASRFETTEVCRLVSEATRKICAGEIEQSLDGQEPKDEIERYFRIIERKTAVLFEASCRLGAYLGSPGAALAPIAGDFGRHMGIAYQIYDDLVDVIGSEANVGKTLGTDLASGKRTLPLILLKRKLSREGQHPDDLANAEIADLMLQEEIVSEVEAYFAREMEKAESAADVIPSGRKGSRLSDVATFLRGRFDLLLAEATVRL